LTVNPQVEVSTVVEVPPPARKGLSPLVAILCGIGLALVGLFIWMGVRNLQPQPPALPPPVSVPPAPPVVTNVVETVVTNSPPSHLEAGEGRAPSRPEAGEDRAPLRPQDVPASISTNAIPVSPTTEPVATPESPKSVAVVSNSVPVPEENLGPIPNRTYTWLNKADRPQKVDFELANRAVMELMPVDKGTFFMTNPWMQGKTHHKVTLTRQFWMGKFRLLANDLMALMWCPKTILHPLCQGLFGKFHRTMRLVRDRNSYRRYFQTSVSLSPSPCMPFTMLSASLLPTSRMR